MSKAVALGFRAHSGWSAAVAVAGSPDKPVILDRRRLEIADADTPGSKQPYHSAKPLSNQDAETLIRQCRESSLRLAIEAIGAWTSHLGNNGFTVVGVGILFASGRKLPELSAILRSHALIHTAEGEFFREVLVAACEQCGLPVTKATQREMWLRATSDIQRSINGAGLSIGPPWQQDQKLASLAALLALTQT